MIFFSKVTVSCTGVRPLYPTAGVVGKHVLWYVIGTAGNGAVLGHCGEQNSGP